MKTIVPGGVVRALTALGLVSIQAAPALAAEKSTVFNSQLQWVTQLIVKEKANASGAFKTQSVTADSTVMRADVATVQRWSAAAQLPVTYNRAMSGGAHVVTLPRVMTLQDAQTVAQRMQASGQFEHVSPDRIMRSMALATDPLFPQQWNLLPGSTVPGGANVTAAWDTTTGAGSVNVGIVDTGIRADHADFVGLTFNTGYNFVSDSDMAGMVDPKTGQTIPSGFVNNGANNTAGNSDPSDPGDWVSAADANNYPTLCGSQSRSSSWHGTFVAGLIAAQRNNGVGIAGIAPGVRVQMARALGKCGGATSDIMDAMTWLSGGSVPGLANNPTPAQVINMSLGGVGACSTLEQDAITAARNLGATIVVATGNEAGPVDSPANCTGTIAVTANTREGDSAYYANVGAQTTISAPGGGRGTAVQGTGSGIVSLSNSGATTPIASPGGDAYANDIGTSMATPHVAAVAALMLSIQPALTPDTIATLLKQSSRPFPSGTYCATHTGVCGAGLLDAGAAITQAQGMPTVHVAPSVSTATTGTAATLRAVSGPGYGRTAGNPVWTQTSGPPVTLTTTGPDANGNSTATFTPSAAGVYIFSLTLTNSAGSTASDTATVTVTPGPTSPVSTNGSGSSSSGGGGHLPSWLAGLLLAAGAAGFPRRKAP